ncbi:polysaccharide biosynthesis tyrosine autokinase [Microbacterium sp. ARD31]|uniref:polysaccharide biosynthesis tyrosine autokinase n=1 Tax=Microbacterium sp. ARD31 TaxID=2962576 RepID=UPI002882758E|nr:polysaccharide biosynthesis tyrosine autokinase [Microbacterium sp. ARD31]MDT0185092.1 polysaccharide biosynthesis tyrosine autokinase [Microbacterium sp. ARD31]
MGGSKAREACRPCRIQDSRDVVCGQQSSGGVVQLRDYVALLRRNWVIVVAWTVIGGSVGALVALTSPTTYQSTSQLYVSVRNSGAAWDLAQSTSYARQAVTSYARVVPTSIVLDPVIDDLGLDVTARQLATQVTASAPLDTQLISITVTDGNPSLAAQLANAISDSFASSVTTRLEAPTGARSDSQVRVETISPAKVPTAPSAPNLQLDLALGLLIGLAVGVGLAVLRSVLDTRVHTVADIESLVDAPILGGIPFDPDSAERPLIVQAAPRDPGAEAYRRLRTNVQFLNLESSTPTFVITSSAPAEGKSTTAANLALTLAETGMRVALIDADLRKPRVADNFGVEGGVGLADVLAGRVALSDAVQHWGRGKLFLLTAGTLPPNPAELLGSRRMWQTLEELRRAFDYIIIDAPPLLAVTDAAVLARLTTGAILVSASGSTRKPQLAAAVKAVTSADAKVRGVIITKLPTKGPDSAAYSQYTYGVTHASP